MSDPKSEAKSEGGGLLRLFGDVRSGEGATVLIALATLFFAFFAYYILKVAREPLIFATGGAEAKAYASALQALVLFFVVPLYSAFVRKVDRRKLIIGVLSVFLVMIVLFAIGAAVEVPYIGLVFYVWVGIFSLMVVAQFWSFANDVYSKPVGERLFPIIAIAAPVGSTIGSIVPKALADAGFRVPVLLGLAAALLAVHLALYVWLFRRPEVQDSEAPPPKPSEGNAFIQALGGFAVVGRSRYLLMIAGLILLLNLVNTNGEFILGKALELDTAQALARAGGVDADAFRERMIAEFYGSYYTFVNIASIVLQTFLASRIVKLGGFRAVLLLLPIVSLGTYSIAAAGAALAILRWAKVAENATDYSIMNTARAMVWLPTTREQKYMGKQAIDTFLVRIGDMLSAGAVFVGLRLLGFGGGDADTPDEVATVLRSFAGGNIVLIVLWFAIAVALVRAYEARSDELAKDPPAKA